MEQTDGPRVMGVQAHQRMVASLKKQIAVQEKKLEEVIYIHFTIQTTSNMRDWRLVTICVYSVCV